MGRAPAWRFASALLLAFTMGLQALASCGLLSTMLGARAACCPSHDVADGASVAPPCCDPAAQVDGTLTLAPAVPLPALRPSEPFSSQSLALDPCSAYARTLPMASHGHAPGAPPILLI